jgi:hypothetical protein
MTRRKKDHGCKRGSRRHDCSALTQESLSAYLGYRLARGQARTVGRVGEVEQFFELLDVRFGFDVRPVIERDRGDARVGCSAQLDRIVADIGDLFGRKAEATKRLGVGLRLRHHHLKVTR